MPPSAARARPRGRALAGGGGPPRTRRGRAAALPPPRTQRGRAAAPRRGGAPRRAAACAAAACAAALALAFRLAAAQPQPLPAAQPQPQEQEDEDGGYQDAPDAYDEFPLLLQPSSGGGDIPNPAQCNLTGILIEDGSVYFNGQNAEFANCGPAPQTESSQNFTIAAWTIMRQSVTPQIVATRGVLHDGDAVNATLAFDVGVLEGVQTSNFQIVREDDPATCWNGLPAGVNNCTCGEFNDTSLVTQTLLGNGTVVGNVWHFMAWTYDGQHLTYYLDGNVTARAKCPGRVASPDCSVLGFASELVAGDGFYTGVLDTITVWNETRTLEQLNKDLTLRCNDLVNASSGRTVPEACYSGETTDDGFTLVDKSPNANDCSLSSRVLEVKVSHSCVQYNQLKEAATSGADGGQGGGGEAPQPPSEADAQASPTASPAAAAPAADFAEGLFGALVGGQSSSSSEDETCADPLGSLTAAQVGQVCDRQFQLRAAGALPAEAVLPGNTTITAGYVAPFRSLAQAPTSLNCRAPTEPDLQGGFFVYSLPTDGSTNATSGCNVEDVRLGNASTGLTTPGAILHLSNGTVVDGGATQSGESEIIGSNDAAPPVGYFGGVGAMLIADNGVCATDAAHGVVLPSIKRRAAGAVGELEELISPKQLSCDQPLKRVQCTAISIGDMVANDEFTELYISNSAGFCIIQATLTDAALSAGLTLADAAADQLNVSVLAGSGIQGNIDGPPEDARFMAPAGLAYIEAGSASTQCYQPNQCITDCCDPDCEGNAQLFVADRAGSSIRRVNLGGNASDSDVRGNVSTYLGTVFGFRDSISGTPDENDILFAYPTGLRMSKIFNSNDAEDADDGSIDVDRPFAIMYVTDQGNNVVRLIETVSCITNTLVGAFTSGSSAVTDGFGPLARFSNPGAMDSFPLVLPPNDTDECLCDPDSGCCAVNRDGDPILEYLAVTDDNTVRLVDVRQSFVFTLAGSATDAGLRNDDLCSAPTVNATYGSPAQCAADSSNEEDRVLSPEPAGNALFCAPAGVAVLPALNSSLGLIPRPPDIFVSDALNSAMRIMTVIEPFCCPLEEEGNSITAWEIAAIVVSGVLLLAAAALVCFGCFMWRSYRMTPHLFLAMWRRMYNAPPGADGEAGYELTLATTDIEKSTDLWEADPVAMNAALRQHHQVMRQLISKHSGYESNTEGDAFVVAFHTSADAVLWALEVQDALLEVEWSDGLLGAMDGWLRPIYHRHGDGGGSGSSGLASGASARHPSVPIAPVVDEGGQALQDADGTPRGAAHAGVNGHRDGALSGGERLHANGVATPQAAAPSSERSTSSSVVSSSEAGTDVGGPLRTLRAFLPSARSKGGEDARRAASLAKPPLLWRGLRVRIGIHTGVMQRSRDKHSGRFRYSGQEYRVARAVGDAAKSGGTILLSGQAFNGLNAEYVQNALSRASSERRGDNSVHAAPSFMAIHMGEHVLIRGSGTTPAHDADAPIPLIMLLNDRLRGRIPHMQGLRTVAQTQPGFFDAPAVPRTPSEGTLPPLGAVDGEVTLVFLNVPDLLHLLRMDREATTLALERLLDFLHVLWTEHAGYPAESVDALHGNYVIAFRAPADGVRFCCDLQERAMDVDWPKELLALNEAAEMSLAPRAAFVPPARRDGIAATTGRRGDGALSGIALSSAVLRNSGQTEGSTSDRSVSSSTLAPSRSYRQREGHILPRWVPDLGLGALPNPLRARGKWGGDRESGEDGGIELVATGTETLASAQRQGGSFPPPAARQRSDAGGTVCVTIPEGDERGSRSDIATTGGDGRSSADTDDDEERLNRTVGSGTATETEFETDPGTDGEGASAPSAEGADPLPSCARGVVFRGLRVACGICTGVPSEVYPDATTSFAQWKGPVINRAARIANRAAGGQTLCARYTWERALRDEQDAESAMASTDDDESTPAASSPLADGIADGIADAADEDGKADIVVRDAPHSQEGGSGGHPTSNETGERANNGNGAHRSDDGNGPHRSDDAAAAADDALPDTEEGGSGGHATSDETGERANNGNGPHGSDDAAASADDALRKRAFQSWRSFPKAAARTLSDASIAEGDIQVSEMLEATGGSSAMERCEDQVPWWLRSHHGMRTSVGSSIEAQPVGKLRLKGVRGSIPVVQVFPESLAGRAFRVRGSGQQTGRILDTFTSRVFAQRSATNDVATDSQGDAQQPVETLARRARRRGRAGKHKSRKKDTGDASAPVAGAAQVTPAKVNAGLTQQPVKAAPEGWLARHLPIVLGSPQTSARTPSRVNAA